MMMKKLFKSLAVILTGTILTLTFILDVTASETASTDAPDPITKLIAKEENKKTLQTEVIHEEISYQILDTKITKEIGEYEKETIYYFTEETDDVGNLTGAYQYLWITMKIKNLSENDKEVWLNKCIYNITAENYVLSTAAEARYIAPDSKGIADTTRFFYNLKGNEEAEVVIGYILDETYTQDSPLYYCLSADTNYSDDLFLYVGELKERTTNPYKPEEAIVQSLIEASMQETEMSDEELNAWNAGWDFTSSGAFSTIDTHKAELNQPVITDFILYQIMDVEISKEIGDYDPSMIDYGNIAKDENGNITDAATFIWITLKLKNYESIEQSFWLNNSLYGIDENNTVYETLSSVRYIDPVEEDAKPYQELFLTLEGGEEREVTLGYIIADESEANCRSDLPLYYRTELRGDKPSFYMYVGELTNGNE